MGLFDDLSKTVSDLSRQTAEKTKRWTEMARIRALIAEEEGKRDSSYQMIGKLYVQRHAADPGEDFQSLVEAARKSEAAMEAYREQLRRIRGMLRCETCGTENPDTAAYCGCCGRPLPRKPQEGAESCAVRDEAQAPGQEDTGAAEPQTTDADVCQSAGETC